MRVNNKRVADILNAYADELENIGENPYRIRACRRAAKAIAKFPKNIKKLVEANALTDIPYVGQGIASIIDRYIKNNTIPIIKKKPKKIIDLSMSNLSIVNKDKRIISQERRQFRLFRAIPIVENLLNKFKRIAQVQAATCVGDYRRKKEIFNGLNIIFVAKSDCFKAMSDVIGAQEIIKITKNKFIIKLYNDIPIAFTRVKTSSYGAAMLAATGSQQHYARLQKSAVRKKLHLSEKGLYKDKKRLASKNEKDIYTQLNLSYIEPELRECRGEIEAARNAKLPKLVKLIDIKGDLHSHTLETDGTETLETMVNAAIAYGYEYFAITDHSQHLTITNGLDKKRLLAQIKIIDKLNAKLAGKIIILKAIEVDILEDGRLDLPNSILKELDLRVCSIHSKFRLSVIQQTERIIRAMDNPYFNIWAHPTGRLIKKRDPYPLDMQRIFKAAKERNCFFELNGQPYRLDLNDEYCKMAKEMGLKLAISSDAHSIRELNFMQFGIYQARRGWLEAADVINTYPLKELFLLLRRN